MLSSLSDKELLHPLISITKILLSKEQLKEFEKSQDNTIPLGRVGKPSEIARAVVFLAPDDSSFINGIEQFVDGGVAQIQIGAGFRTAS